MNNLNFFRLTEVWKENDGGAKVNTQFLVTWTHSGEFEFLGKFLIWIFYTCLQNMHVKWVLMMDFMDYLPPASLSLI